MYKLLVLVLALAMLGTAAPARAAELDCYGAYGDWPNFWLAIPTLNDAADGVPAQVDFVGDRTNPGVYFNFDREYVYFRVRVNAARVRDGARPTFNDTIRIFVDANGDGYEDYAFVWDTHRAAGADTGLELNVRQIPVRSWIKVSMNDADGDQGTHGKRDFRPGSADGYVRTVDRQPTEAFGQTTFVDFAISWRYLYFNTLLHKGQTWRLQLGSYHNAGDDGGVLTDLAGDMDPRQVGHRWSEPIAVPATEFYRIRLPYIVAE